MATAGVIAGAACSRTGYEGTLRCSVEAAEAVVQGDRIEIRVRGGRVAWSDGSDRGVDTDLCREVRKQEGWFVGIPYARARAPTRLSCRFRDGFFVHVHPTYSSESGEAFPDGSAIYLVIERRRTIVLSASTAENGRDTGVAFSERFCARKRR